MLSCHGCGDMCMGAQARMAQDIIKLREQPMTLVLLRQHAF